MDAHTSGAPTISKGNFVAASDLGASRKLLVAPVDHAYPLKDGMEVMNPLAAALLIATQT
jgi:hypothetical protein